MGPTTSWLPLYVVVRDGDDPAVVGAAPLYVERFGDGDFLGDDAIEMGAMTHGLAYVPKLVVGVPFMPVPGPRFLVAPGRDAQAVRESLAAALADALRATGAPSAHLQLGLRDEVDALRAHGFVERLGCQYHWHRGRQRNFADYLDSLDAKRRRSVKQEMAALEREGIRIETLRDQAVTPELARDAAELNHSLFRHYGSEPWLSADLFVEVARTMPDRLELVHAYAKGDATPVGAAINATRGGRMYGRYWGWRRQVRFLHFAVCYYHPIRDCLARGLDAFEPGAGGDHKRVRGLEPTPTWSAHWVRDARLARAFERFLAVERPLVAEHLGRSDLARPPGEPRPPSG